MKQNEAYVEKDLKNALRLTDEELASVMPLGDLPDEEREALREFVFNLSYVLYKLYSDE